MFLLKWHLRNYKRGISSNSFKIKSTFTPRNKDVTTEIYFNSLEEKLLKIEVPKDKFNNLTKGERDALQNVKNDKTIVIKGAEKGSAVVACDKQDYIKEAKNQLGDTNIVYKKITFFKRCVSIII